jgi:DtxR family Mn-dependent transcriptional regulator
MDIGKISESLEDYIEIIHHLTRENGLARVKDIADRKHVSMASVNSALKRLHREGLIQYRSRGIVALTEEGASLAAGIVSRHEFIKNFLVSILDVPEDVAERDACSFEHYMSPETFRGLVSFFEFVETCEINIRERFQAFQEIVRTRRADEQCMWPECPYRGPGRRHRWGRVRTLSMLKPGESGIVARIQAGPGIRRRLIDMGVLPKVKVTMERTAPLGDPIEIKLRGYHLSLRRREADSIILEPVS